jgi:hypothetical protein
MLHSPRHVAEVLRLAIDGMERNADVSPHHPDLLELKRILEQKLAMVQVEDSRAPDENLSDAA